MFISFLELGGTVGTVVAGYLADKLVAMVSNKIVFFLMFCFGLLTKLFKLLFELLDEFKYSVFMKSHKCTCKQIQEKVKRTNI
jgi:sugar phosphate permease